VKSKTLLTFRSRFFRFTEEKGNPEVTWRTLRSSPVKLLRWHRPATVLSEECSPFFRVHGERFPLCSASLRVTRDVPTPGVCCRTDRRTIFARHHKPSRKEDSSSASGGFRMTTTFYLSCFALLNMTVDLLTRMSQDTNRIICSGSYQFSLLST